jgi:(1->4)-alpha-D-glucan 1-alpha-D-glucosylmutase
MSSSRERGPASPLTATYRLQLNADFTLRHAHARVDYFDRLGVSHLYLSPVLAARRGSRHGYDVIDPTRINPELGTEEDLRMLADELHARGMGVVLDIVPNHMGIGSENSYWDDVLCHGDRSRFAHWFDIDWSSPYGRKVILPVLGDELERVVARGELSVQLREGETPRFVYFDESFPIDPSSLPAELQLAQVDPEETSELTSLYSGATAENRERMRALLDAQHYALVFWRRARTEINYRRFFDVTDLAALRVEEPDVFDATHALILRLVHEKVIDGLRVDHVDGLSDPEAYLERLRAATSADTPIFVEKILAPDERLPGGWPVQGTTGYEFLNGVENIFLDPIGTARIEHFYRRLRRLGPTTFEDVARAGKIGVLDGPLRADVDRLVRLLRPIAGPKRRWTSDEMATALIEFVAALPVYRTYIDARGVVSPADGAAIRTAVDRSIANGASRDIVELTAGTLLDENSSANGDDRLAFAQRLQQLSGPAAAKGVEDTALYVYVPVTSRDEVGGEPDQPLLGAVDRFHRANEERAECWPKSLIATNTHDTKRSADVRARLAALTEDPGDWERVVRRWRKLNARHRRVVKGRLAPDTNTEYLMYQAIVALWPPPRAGRRADDLPDRAWLEAARDRLTEYAIKAAREAKTRTSWVEPNEQYERALTEFVAAVLEPADDAPFLPDLARLVSRVALAGVWNALARVAVHLTAPGTADLYQGDELWNYTLVDPDNRRRVDFDARTDALGGLEDMENRLRSGTLPDPFDHRLKLLVTQRLLRLRRRHPEIFGAGGYSRVPVSGPRSNHVVAFARTLAERCVVTVVPRLVRERGQDVDCRWWRDTVIEMPPEYAETPFRSALIDADVIAPARREEISRLFDKLPVAVLVN